MTDTEEFPVAAVEEEEKDAKKSSNDSDDDEDDDFRAKIFPQRLMELLSDERNNDCISWLPHGRAFIIRNRKLFAEKVMPKFFPRKSKYSSFTRKLNRWNFVRISSGPELGAYYHEFFLRDKPHLAAQMFCKNARTKLAMATHGENPASQYASAAGTPAAARRPPVDIPTAGIASLSMNPPAAASLPAPTPNFNVSSQYAAAAAALKQNLMPPAADERMMLQLREQQKLLETQMSIVRQADPATRLILQQAILKEQSVQMNQLGVALPQQQTPAASQTLLASTLALQQSQARLMQMREILKMRFRQQNSNQSRSPHNNRASAA
ncbi:HSF-type DNA-binding [Seminavis robusta]|uniref:HSF-type DNA-binding n=1 Tax=Seminavis robusta TaxID=568900 RepID=A0A9N8H6D5_9STRA|nr:HSF-type DNA-binding [Seminavis robusta]|eukprot:Sro168_g074740.1 HSF-type DNA-binding (323) ;mRNA; r:27579-28644